MNFTTSPTLSGANLLSSTASTSVPTAQVGQLYRTRDGREFRYVKAGASALVAGNIIQAPAQITNHQQMTPSAAAVGAVSISVTPGATAGAANLYAGGWAVIDTTPGEGYSYPIKSHAAITASVAFTLNLHADAPIQVALTTSSRVSLFSNPYNNVIQMPVTTLTNALVGVAVYPIAAAEYGWIQTKGACGVLINGTPAVGVLVGGPGTVAGAADVNSGTEAFIGAMMCTGVDTKILPVLLNLP